jgi:hypothetical protein
MISPVVAHGLPSETLCSSELVNSHAKPMRTTATIKIPITFDDLDFT